MTVLILYALIATDSCLAVDVFATRELAEQALAEVLADEPGFEDILAIEAFAAARDEPSLN